MIPNGGRTAVRTRLSLALSILLILAACAPATPGGGSDDPATGTPGASGGGAGANADGTLTITDDVVDDPAVQVRDALAADGPVRVSGSLFVDADGAVLLCAAMAESFPPQCGGERLEVIGLDLDDLDLEGANGVRWSEVPVELVGTVGE